MTKTINNNAIASKALPVIRARYMWKTIGGIVKTIIRNDNRPAPMDTRIHINMREEALNLSFKAKWAFAQRLA